jgi:hypothetical protein
VRTLKAAGLAVSVIVMAGVGGAAFAAGHVRDTTALLNAMPLAGGDLVYLSEFRQPAGSAYARAAAARAISPLSPGAIRDQAAAIRRSYRPGAPAGAPQFARYDIDEFIY